METFWWVSPGLVALGILANMALGARREAKASGVRDEKLHSLDRRVTAHGIDLEGIKKAAGDQSERIRAVEVRCQTLRCDELHLQQLKQSDRI